MAENPADGLIWYLETDQIHQDHLGAIRHWGNLKVATDNGTVWIKDFTGEQIDSVAVKSIPFSKIYYQKDHLLFLRGHLLPVCKVPSLLWTPIERALPVVLPDENHNFFGIGSIIRPTLIPSVHERPAFALLTPISRLQQFMETTSSIRLRGLQWTVLDKELALIIGFPLLPLPGQTFWKEDAFLLPSGYDFELPILTGILQHQVVQADGTWAIWQPDNTYRFIREDQLQPLSIGSFRQTLQLPDLQKAPA